MDMIPFDMLKPSIQPMKLIDLTLTPVANPPNPPVMSQREQHPSFIAEATRSRKTDPLDALSSQKSATTDIRSVDEEALAAQQAADHAGAERVIGLRLADQSPHEEIMPLWEESGLKQLVREIMREFPGITETLQKLRNPLNELSEGEVEEVHQQCTQFMNALTRQIALKPVEQSNLQQQ